MSNSETPLAGTGPGKPPRRESRVPVYLWLVFCAVIGGLIPALGDGDMEQAGRYAFAGVAIGLVVFLAFSAITSAMTR